MANVNARRVEEILTSGITAGHYVAGSNITITENQDGTETIASTGGGGGGTTDYSDLTNKPSINNVTLSGDKTTSDLGIDEVPDVTSSDNGKILKASYSGSTGTYSWGNLSSTNVTDALSSAQQDAINSGITAAKVTGYDTLAGARGVQNITEDELLAVFSNHTNITNGQYYCDKMFGTYTTGGHAAATLPSSLIGKKCFVTTEMSNAVESGSTNTDYVGRQTIRFIGVNSDGELVNIQNAIRNVKYRVSESDFDIMFKFCSKWKFINNSSFINATEYEIPTAGTGVTDVVGGYVIANNICTVDISCKYSSPSTGQVLFSGLPKPALKPGSSDSTISTVLVVGSTSSGTAGKNGAHVYLTQGGSIIASDESYSSLGVNSKIITGSYLVDTST